MHRTSIRGIFVWIYLLAIVIALVLGLEIYQVTTTKERLAQRYLKELEMTKTCEDFLGLIIENIDQQTKELTLNQQVIDAFEKKNLRGNLNTARILNEWILRNTEIESILMMGLDEELLAVSKVTTNQLQEEKFINQLSKEVLQYIDEQLGGIYVGIGSDYMGEDCEQTVYIARRITGIGQLETIGYMFYFLDYEALKEQLSGYLERNNYELLLVDKQEQVLSFNRTDELLEKDEEAEISKLQVGKKNIHKMVYQYAEISSTPLGIKLLGKYKVEPEDNNLSHIIIAFSIINLIFIAIATLALKNIVITPLEEISQIARQISREGTLSTRFKVSSLYKEGNIIEEALNEMLNKINQLILEGEERERHRRVLELSVINHQVNPHFLFNTLNSVSLLISVEDKQTALNLVKGLAKYYRACLTQDNNINTVAQELTIMREYVHIIELKNPDLIRMSLEVDENTYDKKMPRMIMQTLVENSIKYGIKTMDEPLEIQMYVKADYKNNRTILEIRDNGKGIEEEIRQNILQGITLKDKSGFGLKSTIKRISLLYQVENIEDIIEIDSKIDEYTLIKFYIPW